LYSELYNFAFLTGLYLIFHVELSVPGHIRNFPKEYHAAVKPFLDQQLLHAIGTSPKDIATAGTENERFLVTEHSESGSGTQPPQSCSIDIPSLVSTPEKSIPWMNPPLNSKL